VGARAAGSQGALAWSHEAQPGQAGAPREAARTVRRTRSAAHRTATATAAATSSSSMTTLPPQTNSRPAWNTASDSK